MSNATNTEPAEKSPSVDGDGYDAVPVLESLMHADNNLMMWCSHPGIGGSRMFFIWSKELGPGPADDGEYSLVDAIKKFDFKYGHQLRSS